MPDQNITLVLTSAGRYDLLARTLESLYTVVPPRTFAEVIIAEDWEREGQVKNIDRAYARVKTGYIFHAECDWEFYAPNFLWESFNLLERHPEVLQVQLRGQNDTNGHPVVNGPLYRYMDPYWSAGWYGFSWNPGLRRKSDWERIGGYMRHWAGSDNLTEQRISKIYRDLGMVAAMTNTCAGYVRHIGEGRSLQK